MNNRDEGIMDRKPSKKNVEYLSKKGKLLLSMFVLIDGTLMKTMFVHDQNPRELIIGSSVANPSLSLPQGRALGSAQVVLSSPGKLEECPMHPGLLVAKDA